MTRNLADQLLSAAGPEEFVRDNGGNLDWHVVAELKSEVDRTAGADLKAADRLTGSIEKLASFLGDPVSSAFAMASRARLLYQHGRHLDADALYETAITTLRSRSLNREAGRLMIQRVGSLRYLGRYRDALKVGSAARRLLGASVPEDLAQLETNVGNVYFHLDQYKKALAHYDRARALLENAGDDAMRAIVDFCRSSVFIELDKPDEAMALLEAAGESHEKAGQPLISAEMQCQIAYLQYLKGNYNAGLNTYYRARDRLAELGGLRHTAFFDLEIAEVLLSLNAFDDASSHADRAREGFAELGMSYEMANAQMLRALARMGLGEHDAARTALVQARETYEQSGNQVFAAVADSYLADLALRRNDPADARARAEAALAVFARRKLLARSAQCRLQIARAAYQEGALAEAAKRVRRALSSVKQLFLPGITYRCHHLLGSVLKDRGKKRDALESFRRAVTIVETMRGGIAADDFKATFLQDKAAVYEDTISLCLDFAEPELVQEAFQLVESSKSRALADLIARYVRGGRASDSSGAASEAEKEARDRLSRFIEDLNWYSSNASSDEDEGEHRGAHVSEQHHRAIARCERQIAHQFRRMESEGSRFAEIQRMMPITEGEFRQSLRKGETAIEYFFAGDRVCAFVATREEVKVIRDLASRREIERTLAFLRFQIEKFNYGTDYVDAHFNQLKRAADQHLSDLYCRVFQPIESEILGSEIIIIPHGCLHYVPFHALKDGGDYLVDRYEISYAPSASVLRLCRTRERKPTGGKLVSLGVAKKGTPGIDDELRSICALFPGSVRLSGREATRENLLKNAPAARFLHLASHGTFRRDNPMFSFLSLADSRLDFYSLLDLELNAEMVTLSACRTGMNQVFPGDELHGLMRGFLYAGAPSLVVSLWAVSDRSTADMMRVMYSRLSAGDEKRKAIRKAQLAVKEAYGHPYYWAPFVLLGDPA